MRAADKIAKARTGLILDHPFFGTLALRLACREDGTCETAWTDGKTLGYNPKFVNGLSLDQLKGLIAHEVMHCALQHATRRGQRDAGRWNIAGDRVINPTLTAAGLVLPPTDFNDPRDAGKSTDEIYASIAESKPEPGDGGKGSGAGTGDDDGDQAGEGESDPGGCGAVRDATDEHGDPSTTAQAQTEQEWKIATQQAAAVAKAAGQLPASLARLVEDALAPLVDWRAALREFVDQTARNDYTWMRPSRRYAALGLYLPSLRSEELPPIAVAVDTSGSITPETLNQFAAELTAILAEYRTSAHVIYCDAAVAHVDEVSSDDLPLTLTPHGGGGTDFRPPFDYLTEHGIEPACMVYLTDLECYSFPEAPAYPVLWARVGKGGTTPPFGQVVQVGL